MVAQLNTLTLNYPSPDEEKKKKLFIFTLLCGASKSFMKAFYKGLKAPGRSEKIKL